MRTPKILCAVYTLKSQGFRLKEPRFHTTSFEKNLALSWYEEDDTRPGYPVLYRLRQDRHTKKMDCVVMTLKEAMTFDAVTRRIDPWLHEKGLNPYFAQAGYELLHYFLEKGENPCAARFTQENR
ncbi:hypothetical protein AGMMS49949_03150 [Alphaproteobacteria bacterium]|nr:hypothetical protein AGMMS49949_03150 [Alphaproteobacteria bacterium]